jgi:glycerol-3-phosphate acyltransferase PlsY
MTGDAPASSRRGVATGAFLLLALVTIVALFIAITRLVAAIWVPVVLIASMIALYFIACATLPRANVENLRGFTEVLKEFMRYVLGKPGRAN